MTDTDAERIIGLYERHAAAGFVVARHVAEDPACGQHTVWLARHV